MDKMNYHIRPCYGSVIGVYYDGTPFGKAKVQEFISELKGIKELPTYSSRINFNKEDIEAGRDNILEIYFSSGGAYQLGHTVIVDPGTVLIVPIREGEDFNEQIMHGITAIPEQTMVTLFE